MSENIHHSVDEIIELAWKDNVSFDDIEATTGLKEKVVIDIMKTNLKRGSYRLWRRRVNGRKSKHSQKNNIKTGDNNADRLV